MFVFQNYILRRQPLCSYFISLQCALYTEIRRTRAKDLVYTIH